MSLKQPQSDSYRYRIEPLDPEKHRREEFRCESVALTEFLQKRARKEMEARASACFVLVEESDPGRIAGYYTMSQTSIRLQQLPENLSRRLPRYSEIGATLIGRLARDIAWRGGNLGGLLLMDALRRSVRLANEAGAVVVVTDPKDTKAGAFYAKFGFVRLDDRRMFIAMRELVEREERDWTA
jgi:predicted GNAT family N-acyltransferase